MNYALFEDAQSVRLNPLVRLMPVFDLRCGIVTIRRKFELLIGSEPVALFTRPQLASLVEATNPDVVVNQLPETPTLVLNGR